MSSGTGSGCVWPVEGDTTGDTAYSCGQDKLGVDPSLAIATAVTEGSSELPFTYLERGAPGMAPIFAESIIREVLLLALGVDELIHSSRSPTSEVLLHSQTGGAAKQSSSALGRMR